MKKRTIDEDVRMRDVLAAIDLQQLNHFFGSLAERSGVRYLPLSKEHFFLADEDQQEYAVHNIESGDILFNPISLSKLFDQSDDPTVRELIIVYFLTHEASHAAGKNGAEEKYFLGVARSRSTSGYRRQDMIKLPFIQTYLRDHDTFMLFNEAVIEKIARQSRQEYEAARGFKRASVDTANSILENNVRGAESYNDLIQLLDRLTTAIAEKNGISEHIAWEAILAGAYQGEDLGEKKISKWLNDTTAVEDFHHRLAELPYNRDLIHRLSDDLVAQVRKPPVELSRKPFYR